MEFSVDLLRLFHLTSLFCLTVLIVKVLQVFQRRRRLLSALEVFPGPPTHWLYGHSNKFLHDRSLLQRMIEWSLQFPYATPIWFGNLVVYLNITHPEYARTLLNRTDPKDNMIYQYFIPWIGRGLLVLSGQKWFHHRKLLTPAFHYDVLKPYIQLMSDSTHIMLVIIENSAHIMPNRFQKEVTRGTSVDIYPYVSAMTLDTIMKCAFSCNNNCQTDRDNPYTQAVLTLTYLVNERLCYFPYHSNLIFNLSKDGQRFHKASKITHQFTDMVIKQRKESLQNEEELEKIQQKRHLDFLDILLCARDENGQGLSDEDLRAEVDTFMFEGHDTTASGISWILYCMAQYPEHQQKCREEIREVLGDRDTMGWEDLNQLHYTTLCIKESLRLCPPVPLLGRQLNKPITFCDGRSVPEGCLVCVCVAGIHLNPEFWPDPEVFDPSRFSSENSQHRHSHAYLPFSAGPRNCIGQTFAMNEMKVAVALTLKTFEVTPDPDKVPIKEAVLVLKSKNGIHLQLNQLHD
ncbi:cytochrome P450 4B1-like isoform X1 [Aquarana catesbeiana]|uniref:cytochrome P450 4B1-like isoform X1 n=1 Tax=Aquarana catesbeiana TaxID=8400 RepID=UPI003CC96281